MTRVIWTREAVEDVEAINQPTRFTASRRLRMQAARHAHQALAPDGTVLLVEPFAGDRLEGNVNPVGRLFYAASTFVCTPNSLSQEVGLGLGAQAGEAGFTRSRQATETPFNLILEARK